MSGPKQKNYKEEKPGLIDRLLHGDHGHASEAEEAEVENDLPIEPKPMKKKVSDQAGASSGNKHQHKKFDKFKKGN